MKTRKKLLSGSTELDRQKQMYRLLQRYSKQIYLPNTWILPYIWQIEYTDGKGKCFRKEEFICNTNNIAFATIIFEAQMLPETVTITDAKLINKIH